MKLKLLVGKHILDAVDFDKTEATNEWNDDDCSVCRFRLDGNIYEAIEDPRDGYRSSMEELRTVGDVPMKNIFPPVEVIGRHRDKTEESYCPEESDVLELVDVVTGGIILSVGTENTDDYYPYYVARFSPEAMATNNQTTDI